VGLLDLFGFEVFQVNSFEQLCINYCNEKLQGLFNELLYENEVKLYQEEGISIPCHSFAGNRICLDLFENEMGVFRVIDSQCNLGRSQQSPQEEARALLKQLEYHNSKNEHMIIHPSSIRNTFYIHHFAGKVEYDVTQFIAKNMDKLEGDLEKIMLVSENDFLSELFALQLDVCSVSNEAAGFMEPAANTPGKRPKVVFEAVGGSPTAATPSTTTARRPTITNRKRQQQTVGSKFRANVRILLSEFQHTQVQYLKCVKPNNLKQPLVIDSPLVYQQLKYSGILEVVHIRQLGYPIRETWTSIHRFLVKNYLYLCVLPGTWQRTDRVSMLVDGLSDEYYSRLLFHRLAIPSPDKWVEGNNCHNPDAAKKLVFLKQDIWVTLLSYHKLHAVRTLQRYYRGYSCRKLIRSMILGFKKLLTWYRIWRRRQQLQYAKRGMILFMVRLQYRIALKKHRLLQQRHFYSYFLFRWRYLVRLRRRRAVSLIIALIRRPKWRLRLRSFTRLIYFLQGWYRGSRVRKGYHWIRWAVSRIQRFWRRYTRIHRFIQLVGDIRVYTKRTAIAVLLKGGKNMSSSLY
jgi:hypothetical protein